jgi:hypothetical protein
MVGLMGIEPTPGLLERVVSRGERVAFFADMSVKIAAR